MLKNISRVLVLTTIFLTSCGGLIQKKASDCLTLQNPRYNTDRPPNLKLNIFYADLKNSCNQDFEIEKLKAEVIFLNSSKKELGRYPIADATPSSDITADKKLFNGLKIGKNQTVGVIAFFNSPDPSSINSMKLEIKN